jgi:hypothetical protein
LVELHLSKPDAHRRTWMPGRVIASANPMILATHYDNNLEDNPMKLHNVLSSLAVAAAVCLSTSNWAGYVLSAAAEPDVGNDVFVNVNLEVDAGFSVDVVAFSLLFDTNSLGFLDGAVGTLNPTWVFDAFKAKPGQVDVSGLGLIGINAIVGLDSGSVARLHFERRGAGTDLGFKDVLINESATVPTPASLPLVALALVLLGWSRKRATARSTG